MAAKTRTITLDLEEVESHNEQVRHLPSAYLSGRAHKKELLISALVIFVQPCLS